MLYSKERKINNTYTITVFHDIMTINRQLCQKRHHTSICDKSEFDGTKKVVLTPSGVGEGVFPVVLLKVDGVIARALIDTGVGSSYVSAKIEDMLNKKPCETTTKRVEMLMGSHLTRMETLTSRFNHSTALLRWTQSLRK